MATEQSHAGRAVFITGATSGLGRRFAQVLAGAGAKVAVAGRRQDRLDALVAELQGLGAEAVAVPLDVTDLAAVPAAFDRAEAALGPLWALVNNSGIGGGEPAVEVSEDAFDRMMATNAKAPLFLAAELARRWIARGSPGRIVNIASIAGLRVLPKLAVYCMSKAAVVHLTRALALEWARHDINVNAICPGYIETEINADFFRSDGGQRMVQRFPRRRIGQAEDLDGAILLLTDPRSGFTTGTVLNVDDGQLLM